MKNLLVLLAVASGLVLADHACARGSSYSSRSSSSYSTGSHSVSGYTRSNGTHVGSYKATNRDATRNDNYSTKGNINPYTGKLGTKPRDGE